MKEVDYKIKYRDKEIINFIDYFLASAYTNMDIENEAVFSREELYNRYRFVIDNLVQKGVYKGLRYKTN